MTLKPQSSSRAGWPVSRACYACKIKRVKARCFPHIQEEFFEPRFDPDSCLTHTSATKPRRPANAAAKQERHVLAIGRSQTSSSGT
jgi:hypothetical protein